MIQTKRNYIVSVYIQSKMMKEGKHCFIIQPSLVESSTKSHTAMVNIRNLKGCSYELVQSNEETVPWQPLDAKAGFDLKQAPVAAHPHKVGRMSVIQGTSRHYWICTR